MKGDQRGSFPTGKRCCTEKVRYAIVRCSTCMLDNMIVKYW